MDTVLLIPLSLVMGFLAAILGIGGGVVLTPILILLGMDVHIAMSISLGATILTSIVASLAYIRQRIADVKLAAAMIIASVPGALAGAYLAMGTPSALLEKLLALFLLAMAGIIVMDMNIRLKSRFLTLKRRLETKDGRTFSYSAQLMLLLPLGLLAGLAAGFFGIGGGPLIVPSLLVGSVPAQVAVATSSVMVNINADAAFLTYLARGGVETSDILPIAPALVVGAYVGSTVSGRIRPSHTKRLLACLLICLSAVLLLR